jgi:hypothetical protein
MLKMSTKMLLGTSSPKAVLMPKRYDRMEGGKNGYTQGWGQNPNDRNSHQLYRTDLVSMLDEECDAHYNNSIVPKMMCASGRDETSPCQGDDGAPLMDADTDMIMGVFAYGSDCNDPTGQPSVFTRVGDNMDWIQMTMDENRDDEPTNNHGYTSSKPMTTADTSDDLTKMTTRRPFNHTRHN